MGGSNRDATVTVGLAGTQEVARGADVALGAWERGIKSVGGAFRSIGNATGEALRGVISDVGHVVAAFGTISAGSAIREVRSYEDETARMAVSSRTNVESVRKGFEDLGQDVGQLPKDVLAYSKAVGRLTGDFQGAAQSVKGLAKEAADSDRSIDSYAQLGVVLHNVARVGGDTQHVLGALRAQSEQFGTVGGPAIFEDQVAALGGTLSRFAIKGEADFLKVTNAAAALGKGLSPEAASRVQQGALGMVAADPMRWERYLGHKITDEHGQVTDPTQVLKEIVAKTKKRYGSRAERVLQLNWGAETGSALAHADFDNQALGSGQSDALGRFLGTDAGRRATNQAKRAGILRDLFGADSTVGRAADAVDDFTSSGPGAAVAGAGAAVLIPKLLGALKLGSILGGGGGGAAAGGGAATTGVGLGVGAGLGIGAAAGIPLIALMAPVLAALGEGSHVKQGFDIKAIDAVSANDLREKEQAALSKAAGSRSSGMQEAMELERARLDRQRQARAALAAPAVDPRFEAVVRELTRQGADLKIAMQAAKEMIEAVPTGPVTVQIVTATPQTVLSVTAKTAEGRGKQ